MMIQNIMQKKTSSGEIEYGDFIASGDPNFQWLMPVDEWDAISINYTSGTTGNPKELFTTTAELICCLRGTQ